MAKTTVAGHAKVWCAHRRDWVFVPVEVTVDVAAIVQKLGAKAAGSKTNKATMAHGAITCRVVA